ncbi:MAG: glycosyltransferase family 2 protein [Planctomycetota bacterium]
MSSPDVSVIVTNYNTGPLLGPCLESLFAQQLDGLRLEVIVVDNASFLDQSRYLAEAERRGARVLRETVNHGHGGGCNRGFATSRGRFVFLINSDVVACRGSLLPLVRHLADHPHTAFVEPRTFIDDDRCFMIPEPPLATPREYTLAAAASVSGRAAHRFGLRQLRHSLAGWRARAPYAQRQLTGAFLGARREVFADLRGYDEGYALYFEDTDLFARVRRRGMALVLVPQAQVIHYGHRSVALIWDEAMRKSRVGRARYLRLHHGVVGRGWDACLDLMVRAARRLHSPQPSRCAIDLGEVASPPRLELADPGGEYLLELAFEPFFLLSCGWLCTGAGPRLSAATWRSLYPTIYHLRALDPVTCRTLATWRFAKVGSPTSSTECAGLA